MKHVAHPACPLLPLFSIIISPQVQSPAFFVTFSENKQMEQQPESL
jgi:hypothetical protein